MSGEAEIHFETKGALGLITLSRPKALNALTRAMCLAMTETLIAWESDAQVRAVAIRGAGDRAFCAGGDIRALYDSGRARTPYALDFYADEYRLNHLIHHFEKPYVALMDGITMGGGVGVSVHGSHRIVTERTVFAMPETGIGLFPDVGGSYFLPRCPGELGTYLALTGERIGAADAVYAGVATAMVPSEKLDLVVHDLAHSPHTEDPHAGVSAVIGRHLEAHDMPQIARHQAAIDRHFSYASVEDILASLEQEAPQSEFAARTLKTLALKSPTSLKITLRQLREGRGRDFAACMRMEYRMTSRVMAGHDFYEGVRAVIIDKDNAPKWRPDHLAAVNTSDVDAYFAPLASGELTFID